MRIRPGNRVVGLANLGAGRVIRRLVAESRLGMTTAQRPGATEIVAVVGGEDHGHCRVVRGGCG
jgi:hypothetical protein